MIERQARYVERVAVLATDGAAVLAACELALLYARVPGTRAWPTAPLLALVAAGALVAACLPVAALVAIRLPRRRPARLAVVAAGLLVAAVALRLDAAEYVRLYGAEHAGLGLATVFAALLTRAGLPFGRSRLPPRAVAIAAVLVGGGLAYGARHDVRAYAAQRGVLLADAVWATHRDVDALPPLPSLATPGAGPGTGAGTATRAPTPLPTRPRLILLVTVDALRSDVARSPTYRAFSAVRDNAVDFAEARAPAAWTVPSVWALMTGRGPWSATFTRAQFLGEEPVAYLGQSRNPRRVWPLPMHDPEKTLAEALRDAGYQTRTCATLPFFVPGGGVVRGFDVVNLGVYLTRNHDLSGTTSDQLTACGLSMIDDAAGAPLFLWLHYSDPHEPYLRHPPPPIGHAATEAGAAPTAAPPASDASTADDDSPRARYAGEVAFVDRHLQGLLVNVQRRVGLENTLVVLTADHGEEFGEHGGEFHAVTLYDEVARVPLTIAAPGLAARRVDDPVSLIDVAPTVLELAGAAPLPNAQGHSLVGAMRGEPREPTPVFAETVRYGRAVRSVVEGRKKLIFEARAGTYELYDLERDPGEEKVLTDDEPATTARLAALMGVPSP